MTSGKMKEMNKNDGKITIGCSSISPFFILFVVFLVLKLCNIIQWPWLWITAPLWIPLSLIMIAVFFIVVIIFIVQGAKNV